MSKHMGVGTGFFLPRNSVSCSAPTAQQQQQHANDSTNITGCQPAAHSLGAGYPSAFSAGQGVGHRGDTQLLCSAKSGQPSSGFHHHSWLELLPAPSGDGLYSSSISSSSSGALWPSMSLPGAIDGVDSLSSSLNTPSYTNTGSDAMLDNLLQQLYAETAATADAPQALTAAGGAKELHTSAADSTRMGAGSKHFCAALPGTGNASSMSTLLQQQQQQLLVSGGSSTIVPAAAPYQRHWDSTSTGTAPASSSVPTGAVATQGMCVYGSSVAVPFDGVLSAFPHQHGVAPAAAAAALAHQKLTQMEQVKAVQQKLYKEIVALLPLI